MEKNENYGKTKRRKTNPHVPYDDGWFEVRFINGYRLFMRTEYNPDYLKLKMITVNRSHKSNWSLAWHVKEDRLCRTKDSVWLQEHGEDELIGQICSIVRGWLSEHKEDGHAEDDR